MQQSRRRRLALASALGFLTVGQGVSRHMRPNRYFTNSTAIATKNNFKRALENTLKTRYTKLASTPGMNNILQLGKTTSGFKFSNTSTLQNIMNDMVPNSLRQNLKALSPYITPAVSQLTKGDIGNTVQKAGGALVYLPALKMKIDLSRIPGFDKIAVKEFTDWSAIQVAMSKAKVPLSIQDTWNQLKTIDVISQVFKTNPGLSAEKDPYGIAPGTHLALPYQNNWKYVTVGKGIFGRFGKQNMRLIIPGWSDDSSFFTGLNSVFHHGVYVGNGMVMHVGGGGVNRLRRGVHADRVGLDTLALMTGFGKGLYIVEHAQTLNKHQIMYNLLKAPGKWNYDRQSRNCEHWATEAVTGVPMSAQVERYVINMFVLVAFLTTGSIELLMNERTRNKHRGYIVNMFRESRTIAQLAIRMSRARMRWNFQLTSNYAQKLARVLREPANKISNWLATP